MIWAKWNIEKEVYNVPSKANDNKADKEKGCVQRYLNIRCGVSGSGQII